jgi:hypothetical protein
MARWLREVGDLTAIWLENQPGQAHGRVQRICHAPGLESFIELSMVVNETD